MVWFCVIGGLGGIGEEEFGWWLWVIGREWFLVLGVVREGLGGNLVCC